MLDFFRSHNPQTYQAQDSARRIALSGIHYLARRIYLYQGVSNRSCQHKRTSSESLHLAPFRRCFHFLAIAG